MDIQKIKRLKDAVEKFGAKFISMVDDTSFIIENEETTGQYIIKFEEDKDALILDASEAQILNEPVKKQNELQQFQENCKILFASMRSVFSEENAEKGIEKLKSAIQDIPMVEEKSLQTFIEAKESIENPKPELIDTLDELFGTNLTVYREMEKDAKGLITMFNEEGELKSQKFIDIDTLTKKIEERKSLNDIYKQQANQFAEVKKAINEVLQNEKLAKIFFEGLDVNKDIKTTVTKKLVSMKSDKEIGVVEDMQPFDIKKTAKQLVAILENTYVGVAGTPLPATYNLASDNKFKTPNFFQFKCGAYSQGDVKNMINELDYFMTLIGELGEEELKDISEAKMVLEYMYHSGQINDHIVTELIKNFNDKYAKDQADAYSNPDMRLAWQNREQQSVGNAQGMAV